MSRLMLWSISMCTPAGQSSAAMSSSHHELVAAPRQQDQQFHRLPFEMERASVHAQLVARQVQFEGAGP